jgi:DNA-binding XRE family transcriptional regulator
MNKVKTINSQAFLKKQLNNKEFKKEYTALEDEFNIAREILKLRKDANLTQKQLAELAKTSQPAIARLESGNYENLSLSFLRKIGKALNAIPEIHFKKTKAS